MATNVIGRLMPVVEGRLIQLLEDFTISQHDISLVANQRYYFEVKHKEGASGDYVGVTAQKPGDSVPATGSVSTMVELSPLKLSQAVAVNPPASITIVENDYLTVPSGVVGWPTPALQWYMNGAAIPGATGTNYTTVATMDKNGAQFCGCEPN